MAGLVFLTISIVVFNLIAFFIPKKMTRMEIYATCLFAIILEIVLNVILDLKYNFYGYFTEGINLETFLVVFGIIPASNVIMLNFYPFDRGIKGKLVYTIIASAGCLLFEWLSLKSGYFYYRVWKLWYSAISYPILIWIMALNLSIIRNRLIGK